MKISYPKRILYIHNQSFSPKSKGAIDTTLLQVFSMCNSFTQHVDHVKLYMEGDNLFLERLEDFERTTFNSKFLFEIDCWKRLHKNRLLNRLIIQKKIRKIVESENPDVIFTRDAFFLRSILKTKTPLIYESHSAKQHNRLFFVHKILQREVLRALKKDNFLCLFCISRGLSEHWETLGVNKKKLFVWHDGFDKNLFFKQLNKKEARVKNQLPKDKTIVTYTGGLYPDREIDNILKLAHVFQDVLFLIIGGPEKNREYYQKLADQQKAFNIIFLGFVNHNDIPYYLYASDVLLALWSSKVPTINYCSPLKLFEYMAAGRIILAHCFPTIKEVLEDNKDAILCEPDNFESMQDKLGKAIMIKNNPVLGRKAREKAFKQYTWDMRVEKLLNHLY